MSHPTEFHTSALPRGRAASIFDFSDPEYDGLDPNITKFFEKEDRKYLYPRQDGNDKKARVHRPRDGFQHMFHAGELDSSDDDLEPGHLRRRARFSLRFQGAQQMLNYELDGRKRNRDPDLETQIMRPGRKDTARRLSIKDDDITAYQEYVSHVKNGQVTGLPFLSFVRWRHMLQHSPIPHLIAREVEHAAKEQDHKREKDALAQKAKEEAEKQAKMLKEMQTFFEEEKKRKQKEKEEKDQDVKNKEEEKILRDLVNGAVQRRWEAEWEREMRRKEIDKERLRKERDMEKERQRRGPRVRDWREERDGSDYEYDFARRLVRMKVKEVRRDRVREERGRMRWSGWM